MSDAKKIRLSAVVATALVAPPTRTLRQVRRHIMFPDILRTFFAPDPVELRKQPKWLSKVRPVAKYADRVATIEALGPAMESLSDEELKGKTGEQKAKHKDTT